jgi:hypothetical protein
MTEDTQASQEPTEVTLDDVIEEFSGSFTPETLRQEPIQQQQIVAEIGNVDPLDNDQWNRYLQSQQQNQSALQRQVQDLNSKLTEYQQREAQKLVEADVKKAVDLVNADLNADPMLVELSLEKYAREKPGFARIWENRNQNPKAYEKALKAISKDLQGKFSVRQDPQLTENRRAVRSSQQAMATKNQPDYQNSLEERLATADNFEAEWARIRGS